MDQHYDALVKYRLEKADEELNAAEVLLQQSFLAKSLNSSYYSMFHALRALLSIYNIDSKKHSGVIRVFSNLFIRTGKISKEYLNYLSASFNIRLQSDYHDFFIASREDAERQIENAEKFMEVVK